VGLDDFDDEMLLLNAYNPRPEQNKEEMEQVYNSVPNDLDLCPSPEIKFSK